MAVRASRAGVYSTRQTARNRADMNVADSTVFYSLGNNVQHESALNSGPKINTKMGPKTEKCREYRVEMKNNQEFTRD